jgi:predicted AAA+ superfamily ATPase
MYSRTLNLKHLLSKKSFFLFGPRATGKTTLIQRSLPDAQIIDLLHNRTYRSLLRDPSLLEELIVDKNRIVVIDEVQKIPAILDEVHRLIQSKRITFLLTGSSARKIKHGGANLLAGRAREALMFPLTFSEIDSFDLLRFLNNGGLPQIYDSPEPDEDLAGYVTTYLKEEIKAEAVTRSVAAFSEFLDLIALSNGQEINYEGFASDLQISTSTLKNYLQILEDTLIGFRIPGFTKTRKRKSTSRAKHYLFDVGVSRHLAQVGKISARSKAFGDAFEHFIMLEARAFLSYSRSTLTLSYWRSTSQFEVDIVIGEKTAIEVKGTDSPTEKHLKGLRALKEESILKTYILVCTAERERRTIDNIHILPWRLFLQRLWAGKFV